MLYLIIVSKTKTIQLCLTKESNYGSVQVFLTKEFNTKYFQLGFINESKKDSV